MLLTAVAAICLIAIVAIVSVGVVMRYVFGAPLLGVNEFVQLTAVALVMAALPFCTARNDHVAVDVFDDMLGRRGRLAGDVISRLLSGIMLGLLAQRAVIKALDAWEWGDATNMLRIPIWPFYVVLAVGAGLCVLVMAAQLVLTITRGGK